MNKVHSLFILIVALISQTAFAGTLSSFGNSSFSVNTEITDISSYSQTSTSLTANGTDWGSNVTGNFSTLFTFANATSSNLYLNMSVDGTNPGSEFHLDLYNAAQDNFYRYTGSTINATNTAANFALIYDGLYNLSGGNATAFTSFSAASFTLDGSGSNINIKLNYLTDGIKTTPTVTWSNPANIIYNAALSGAQLNAVSSVNGTFSYTPASGTVLGAGNRTLSVVFTPSDTANYNTANKSVTLLILKGNQTIGAFTSIGSKTYGSAPFAVTMPAASSGLGVTLSVKSGPASISANNTITLSGVGTVVLAANQAGNANYNAATEVLTNFSVSKAAPVVTWNAPASISYGTALSGAQLNASASVNGTFSYTPVSGTVLGAGNQTLSAVFTPSDVANYNTANKSLVLVVTKAMPTINVVPTALGITYGKTLANATLSGGNGSVPGTFAFTSPTTVPSAGTTSQAVRFTPTDSGNYTTASANVSVTVSKAASVVTWNNPVSITHGTALSGTQLNASASVNGTFSYTPVSGTVLGAGNQTLRVVFTPTDTANYNTANRSVTLMVGKGNQTITGFGAIGGKSYGSAPFAVTAPVASSNLPVTISVKSGPASISGNNIVTLTGVGNVTLAANQGGNSNYNAAAEVVTTFVVTKGNQTISAFANIPSKAYGVAPFVVAAPSATSGLSVTLRVKTGNAIISANNTVTLTGIGIVILAANQPGNSNYNAAPEISTSFNVTRPLSNLTILTPVSANGSVTQGFAGVTQREVGANYTVTAIPASGMLFKEWRKNNTRLTTNATLKFTMEPNLTLTPVFAVDFAKLAGLYNGLVGTGEIGTGSLQDMQSFPVKNGFLAFNLTASGLVSGNLSIEGQTSPFTGNFSSNKTLSLSVARANKTAAPTTLQLTTALPGEISGNITVSGNKLPFRALRAAYTANATAHALGNRTYTLVIPPPDGVLAGHGFATVTTQTNGSAFVNGRLATGDAISASAGFVDSGDGNWVLPIYSTGNSVLTGEMVIPKTLAAGAAEVSGTMEWLRKPAIASAPLSLGFLKRSNISGSRYSIVAGSSLMSGNSTTANFTLTIDRQKRALASTLTQKGIWPASNTPSFVQPVSSGLVITFSSATGNFTGSFNRMVNGSAVPTAFQGAMFGKPVSPGNGQPMLRGAGYFISGNRSVPVEITVP